jgi:hypothetical protein
MNVDDNMKRKMARALAISGDLYDIHDIEAHLLEGKLQGHVEGDTWAITQVHDWPQKRAVNILYIIGSLSDTEQLEVKIEEWAKSIGATMLTAVGRESWWNRRTPGWKKVGTLYSKDITP